jgi:hypothetical protein
MRISDAAAALFSLSCLIVAASCVQSPTASPAGTERASGTEPSEVKDDGDPFGGDPDVGPSIGGSEPSSGVWGPVSSTPVSGPVADPDQDQDPDTSGDVGVDPGYQYTPSTPGRPVGRPDRSVSSPGREPPKPCDAKCESDYEDAAAVCGRMQNDGKRMVCENKAHAIYKSCRANCAASANTSCDDKYQDCIDDGPSSCLKRSGGKTLCQRCWERCNAGDSPSSACKTCLF